LPEPIHHEWIIADSEVVQLLRQASHMRDWLFFFLHGVEETARASIGVFRAILQLKEKIEREVLPRFTTRRQDNAQILMRRLYARPVIDIKAATALIGSTPNTASALIGDFVANGILVEITKQRRNRLFIFAEYLALFQG